MANIEFRGWTVALIFAYGSHAARCASVHASIPRLPDTYLVFNPPQR
jgi:hypothetical protein